MKRISRLMFGLLLTACSQSDDSFLEVTTPVPFESVAQAPLEIALKSRRQGDLISHFHHQGAVYDIRVTPLRVTTIIFQDDERVVTIGAGDTERFNVDLTETDGKHALLVKPIEHDIKTNVSVVTDRRVYVLNLIADSDTNYVVTFEPFFEETLEPMPKHSHWPPKPARRLPKRVAESSPDEQASNNKQASVVDQHDADEQGS